MEWGLFGELALILLLILFNGFFAGAEIAILTAKRGRLEQLSQEGDRGAKAALKLSSDADRFYPPFKSGSHSLVRLPPPLVVPALSAKSRISLDKSLFPGFSSAVTRFLWVSFRSGLRFSH